MPETKTPEAKKNPALIGGLEIMGKGPTYNQLVDKWGNVDLPLWKRKALQEAKKRDEESQDSEPVETPAPAEEKPEAKPETPASTDSFAGSSIRRIAALSEETRNRIK
ncbi:MAG: hypothetical protein ABFD50_20995 [Smithella sp.]